MTGPGDTPACRAPRHGIEFGLAQARTQRHTRPPGAITRGFSGAGRLTKRAQAVGRALLVACIVTLDDGAAHPTQCRDGLPLHDGLAGLARGGACGRG